VDVPAAGVQVLPDDEASEDEMTVPDPTGQPDIERPIDLTDTPDRDNPRPAPSPEHHPDDGELPGDGIGTDAPGVTPVD
jgi:hypothetical protein